MKDIVIRRMTLLNFKGIRKLDIEFNGKETNIYGANAAGKTTIFDAFMWLLFGKDSKGRSDGNRGFNIKTLGSNGMAIPRLPHEVIGYLTVDGHEVILRKTYNEVWQKKRGSAVETFNGHQVECFYNDVPCSVAEYKKKVAEICDEEVFALITNPAYFCAQSKQFQRDMLFRLAGNVTYDEIVDDYPDFAPLVNMLNGKTLDEFKREVNAKKKLIKDSVGSIPARIDEVKRNIPETKDWDDIEDRISSHERTISTLEAQLEDRSKVFEEASKKKQETAKALTQAQMLISERKTELTGNLYEYYHEEKRAYEAAVNSISKLRYDKRMIAVSLPRLNQELDNLNGQIEGLRNEWRALKAEQFVEPDPENFVCPTCKRMLEADDIEAKIDEMRSAFNRNLTERKERNKALGKEVATKIDAKKDEIKKVEDSLFEIDKQLVNIENNEHLIKEPQKPDEAAIFIADDKLIDLNAEVVRLKTELEREIDAPDVNDIKAEIYTNRQHISSYRLQLAEKERIYACNKRIAELENEYSECQVQLATLEGLEFQILQFSKARIEAIESRINGMFKIVRFKMFEQQINGGEVETCEATVNGVPYGDLNSASKVNAGLDIIGAICANEQISAPIFIDNRESVSNIINTTSQIINLIVAPECTTLRVE